MHRLAASKQPDRPLHANPDMKGLLTNLGGVGFFPAAHCGSSSACLGRVYRRQIPSQKGQNKRSNETSFCCLTRLGVAGGSCSAAAQIANGELSTIDIVHACLEKMCKIFIHYSPLGWLSRSRVLLRTQYAWICKCPTVYLCRVHQGEDKYPAQISG